jgi:hypothetical protein
MSTSSTPASGGPAAGSTKARGLRATSVRVIAGTVAASLVVTGVALTAGQGAGAASAPNAQSVGRFLDGALGTNPIQQLADVADARATAPGSQSTQNPLDATLLNSLELPLTGALQLPQLLGINLGAANQVAVAHLDGYSYGASGAVNNSGGVSVGGDNNAFPANATINLSASGIAGNTPIPIPGGSGSADALGGVKATIGAVSALAQTPAGVGQAGATQYQIANLDLELGSPLIGGIVGQVGSAAASLLSALAALGAPLNLTLPAGCVLASGTLPDLNLEPDPSNPGSYAVTIKSSGPDAGTITVHLGVLFKVLGLDLNNLDPNTDVIDLLFNYLTSAQGLAKGLQAAVTGLISDVQTQLTACAPAGLAPLLATLTVLQTTLTNTLNSLTDKLTGIGGTNPLAPLADVLKKLIDIGINVQPNGPAGTFTSQLKATPNQATAVVPGQTIVRAIEVNLVGDPLATLALANAAAGPSAAAPTSSSVSATASTPNTLVPTEVNAGHVNGTGTPVAPIVLVVLGLMMAAGGATAWRFRGKHAL